MTSSITKSMDQKVREFFEAQVDRKTILAEIKGNRYYITFNRPKRLNAFSNDMYYKMIQMIKIANDTPEIKYIIVSGAGGNFSSGNDLNNFSEEGLHKVTENQQTFVHFSALYLNIFCETIINSKKPLFAIVEGKAIGVAFTMLALFDKVFAVENSQFNAPLVRTAQGQEMCSSYTFPKYFGGKMADEIIIKNKKVNSVFLEKYNFATAVKSRKAGEDALDEHLQALEVLDWESYINARRLRIDPERETLLKVNKAETDNMYHRWINPDLIPYLMNYLQQVKKSKL